MKLEAKQRLRALNELTLNDISGINNMVHALKTTADRVKPLSKTPTDHDRVVLDDQLDKIGRAIATAKELVYGKK